ncbi:MAG: hypothetical protein K6G56_01505 [Clostridiales bacterium]|nr:hypothetical protein [Clostridiales bacterium]
MAACNKAGKEAGKEAAKPTEVPQPTETVSEQPTEASAPQPVPPRTEIPAPTEPAYPWAGGFPAPDPDVISQADVTLNDYLKWSEFSKELLEGKEPVGFEFQSELQNAFFGFSQGKTYAYSAAKFFPETGAAAYMYPMAVFPGELGREAQKLLTQYAEDYLSVQWQEGSGPNDRLLAGFFGDDYVVFTLALSGTRAVHCIFFTDDGWKTWRELGHNNAETPCMLTGACMTSETDGWLCFCLRDEKIRVFKTEDGGETWQDTGLDFPDEGYAGVTYTQVASPVFEGARGVIPVLFDSKERSHRLGRFETEDGGRTWTFRECG